LFERLGKRVILTEQGHRFKIYTDQILVLSDEAKSAVSSSDEPSGTLVICAQETQSTYRLPPLLKAFQVRFPKVQLVFRSGISDESIRVLLGNGQLDVAFLFEAPVTSDSLIVEPVCIEPIVLVSHPEHPLVQLSEVKPEDIENQTILLTESGCHYRRIFEETLAVAGIHPIGRLELGNVEAIKRCVITGVGIAALPEVAVANEVAEGRSGRHEAILVNGSARLDFFRKTSRKPLCYTSYFHTVIENVVWNHALSLPMMGLVRQ